jgi:hypothetical protein
LKRVEKETGIEDALNRTAADSSRGPRSP